MKPGSIQNNLNLYIGRRGEILKTYGSNSLLKKVFKFKKFTDINNGLNKTILFFKKNKNGNKRTP